ncbi:acetyl-CoA acetyltransferase [Burkholderia stabilis]|uniref:CaiB/BaiF CoA transferase family protein n=1 Tax=Burkholderia stabilis TaxID=95485 RepID=UPI000851FF7B|nr:CoA transferase [Burkholderia stabilis]AOR73250.1 acetyl-CoA acetyltransferase [Burkholderia stabilis]HDR9494298.1 CoA transferase [Burkholderia stabilis]HDR9541266.1 CoA transferase [Burkholderia stabilis]HDR9570870.1 CoA transferase [Burkholderia stabilis]HDR9579148.1 CoA transferase [Burkholderia stabilis]
MAGPLDGVRILDLTSNFMGPYASLLLADMGADVCKIESRDGDTTRNIGPSRHPGMGPIFLHLNRNKRSIVLDLKHPDGIAALRRMAESADVLLYSMRPHTMAKLGIAYEDVRRLNPRIIYCGAFGFGQNGPYAARPAYDDLIQAAVGMPVLQSRKKGPPTYVATAVADRVVGMATSNAVAMALYRREKTGVGQQVFVPMLETFAHFVLGDHLYGHTFVPPLGDWGYARMMNPDRRPYRTLDGYIGVNVYADHHWHRFFVLSGHPEMAEDPRFNNIGGRTEHIAHLYAFLARVFETRTTAEWIQTLTEADIPVIEMHTPETLLDDPHMKAVDFFAEQDHPSEGRIRTLGVPQQWSESAPALRHPAPRLGEHSVALLAEYGFGPEEIDRMLRSGGVYAPDADSSHQSQ